MRGSHVAAGQDVTIAAGKDVTIASGTEAEKYQYRQKSKGGVFGTSKALSVKSKTTDIAESTITAGNRIDVEAGKDGDGSLTVAGSTLESVGDMSLRAEDDIQILPVQNQNYSKVEKKESGFMDTGFMKLDESQGVTNVRSELNADVMILLCALNVLIIHLAILLLFEEPFD